jgi:hypothetical protein
VLHIPVYMVTGARAYVHCMHIHQGDTFLYSHLEGVLDMYVYVCMPKLVFGCDVCIYLLVNQAILGEMHRQICLYLHVTVHLCMHVCIDTCEYHTTKCLWLSQH